MQELHRAADKLFTEIDHLEPLLAADEFDLQRLELALGIAKRVRRDSTLLVRLLAVERDKLQSQEDTST